MDKQSSDNPEKLIKESENYDLLCGFSSISNIKTAIVYKIRHRLYNVVEFESLSLAEALLELKSVENKLRLAIQDTKSYPVNKFGATIRYTDPPD